MNVYIILGDPSVSFCVRERDKRKTDSETGIKVILTAV